MLLSKGFTLIETLIYVAIISSVIVSFITFSLANTNAANKAYAAQEVQANLRVAINIVNQKIREANGIYVTSSVFNTDPGVLSLSVASSSLNPTIISLDRDNGRLQIKQGGQKNIFLTSEQVRVANLIFSNNSADSQRENLAIDIKIEFADDGDISFNYQQALKTAVSVRQ